MKNNVSWAKALIAGLWAILFMLLATVVTAVMSVWVNNWDWNLFPQVYENLWLTFAIIGGFSFILVIVLYKFPVQTISFILSVIALLLIVSSLKNSAISEAIRNYIDSYFEIDYIATGVILVAFLLGFIAIYRTRVFVNKTETLKEEVPLEETPKVEKLEEEAPRVETPKAEKLEERTSHVEAPKAEKPEEVPSRVEAPKAEKPEEEVPLEETPKVEKLKKETPQLETVTTEFLDDKYPVLKAFTEGFFEKEAPKDVTHKSEAPEDKGLTKD